MNSEKKKVLIIDDQQEIRELIEVSLRGTEFEVLKASGGREGIQIAREQNPDTILLDIMMPGFDGYMVCKVLKRNPNSRDIPIIFLTAKRTKEDIRKALEVGGSDYLMKPFSPEGLLTRLRNAVESKEIKRTRKTEEKKKSNNIKYSTELQKLKSQELSPMNYKRYGDVMVFSTTLDNIVMENSHIYRVAFANIISEGFSKILFDMNTIKTIDGAGLALLISVNETLKRDGGKLQITYPKKYFSNQYSYINIKDLFGTYKTIQEGVDSFHKPDINSHESLKFNDLNPCLSCTYVHSTNTRYCSFCGTNLVAGKDDLILKILKLAILQKITFEAQTRNIQEINQTRSIKIQKEEVPSEFNVEILTDNFIISFNSVYIDSQDFDTKEQIAIKAPFMIEKMPPFQLGMTVRLQSTKPGIHSIFETEIKAVDLNKKIISVHYTEDAKSIHSQKNFSIVPKIPIPISLISPSFDSSYEIIQGKILEMSRIRMIVFSEENIPENQCLSVNFNLPNGQAISSPLCIAQKRKEKFMFDIEFVAIDEKERTKLIQYMYKRQIALVKI